MSVSRQFLKFYRVLLNALFSRQTTAIMQSGVLCKISDFQLDKYKGDIVHPCVRYIDKPFNGSHWWLVYTPYYNANPYIENPILCKGISSNDECPTTWQVEELIRDTPTKGYNSDPTIFFSDESLNIFWRENETERTQKDMVYRAVYGLRISNEKKTNYEKPFLAETDRYRDKEVSPTFIKFRDGYRAYTADLRFKNSKFHLKNKQVEIISAKVLWLLSLLEIYHEQKSYGIAIWESEHGMDNFKYLKTVKIKNSNRLYRPWHFDFFEYDNKLYALVQTNQCNADICLAVSEDYENFRMYSKPLITNKSIGKVGIYKPTGLVHKNIFYLYYTAQDVDNRSLNKMYLTSISFSDLLKRLG